MASRPRVASSSQVIARIPAHTWPRSMPLSRKYKIATTSTSDTPTWTARRVRERGLAAAGSWMTITSPLA
jgi:hypothetical protein